MKKEMNEKTIEEKRKSIKKYLEERVFSENIKNPKLLMGDISGEYMVDISFAVDCIIKFEQDIIINQLNNDREIINIILVELKPNEKDYYYHQAFISNFDLIKRKLNQNK